MVSVRCTRCREWIRPPRKPLRGAFGFDKICPDCFRKLAENIRQKNPTYHGTPTSLKRWQDE